MDEQLFPPEALAILRQALWDPNATRSYEIMSGGFSWSDERMTDVSFVCMAHRSWAFRFLMGFRASLSAGAPREELSPPWDQLLQECPDWPGFREERRSTELAAELHRESRRMCINCLRWEREVRKQASEGPDDPPSSS